MTPAPIPSPKLPATTPGIQGLCRGITLGSPKVIERLEREVKAGNKQIIGLLEGYRHVVPQSLLVALAGRVVAVPQASKDVEVAVQTRKPWVTP